MKYKIEDAKDSVDFLRKYLVEPLEREIRLGDIDDFNRDGLKFMMDNYNNASKKIKDIIDLLWSEGEKLANKVRTLEEEIETLKAKGEK
jgi:hypothetical protein